MDRLAHENMVRSSGITKSIDEPLIDFDEANQLDDKNESDSELGIAKMFPQPQEKGQGKG